MSESIEEIVPPQEQGSESNTEERQSFASPQAAMQTYQAVKRRMFDINRWHDFAGTGTAQFFLCDQNGSEVKRHPQVGDHFKIDIPGPGSKTGEGFDWVQIEAIEERDGTDPEITAIRVRPATNPNNSKADVAHFFSEAATSSFIVRRDGLEVSAAVAGRNESANTAAEKIVDKARNAAIATGAITAFSKLQWSSLVKGFFKDLEEE